MRRPNLCREHREPYGRLCRAFSTLGRPPRRPRTSSRNRPTLVPGQFAKLLDEAFAARLFAARMHLKLGKYAPGTQVGLNRHLWEYGHSPPKCESVSPCGTGTAAATATGTATGSDCPRRRRATSSSLYPRYSPRAWGGVSRPALARSPPREPAGTPPPATPPPPPQPPTGQPRPARPLTRPALPRRRPRRTRATCPVPHRQPSVVPCPPRAQPRAGHRAARTPLCLLLRQPSRTARAARSPLPRRRLLAAAASC